MANKSKQSQVNGVKQTNPPQTQDSQPGHEHRMHPRPEFERGKYNGSEKLSGAIAVITGGDSGIGRAVSVLFAKEGADVVVVYLSEDKDAQHTKTLVEGEGQRCLLVKGDIGSKEFSKEIVAKTIEEFGRIDILVNNAAEQHPQDDFLEIREEDLIKTFSTNIFSFFYLTQECLPSLKKSNRAAIVNTTSVTAYRGSPSLIDYSSTKGAIVSFTRSLSQNLVKFGIRVNAVAPGPIWTPLIPSTFEAEKVREFGSDVPMGRPGQPFECAPTYVYLASNDSSYVTGQVLHVNGGEIING